MLAKLKCPSKGVLQTCSTQLWSDYTDFLFGDEVWGFVAENEHGSPIAGPHIGHIIGFDFKVRQMVAVHMNEGLDIAKAFERAMECPQLRLKHFLMPVSASINDKECRALTAPALQEARFGLPRGNAQKRKITDGGEDPMSAAAKKKARRKAAMQALRDANPHGRPGGGKGQGKQGTSAQLALGDRAPPPPRKGAGKNRSKTGETRLKICYAYNNGQACRQTPCHFLHVCQICEGAHPKGECDQRQG